MKQITAILIIIAILICGIYYFYQTYKQSAITEIIREQAVVNEQENETKQEKVYTYASAKEGQIEITDYRTENMDLDSDGIYEEFLFSLNSSVGREPIIFIKNKNEERSLKFGLRTFDTGYNIQVKLVKDKETGELVHLFEQFYADGFCATVIELYSLKKSGNKIEYVPILLAECNKEEEEKTYTSEDESERQHIMKYSVEGKETTSEEFTKKAKEISEKYIVLAYINGSEKINYGSADEEILIGGEENIFLYNGTPLPTYPRISDYGYTLYNNETIQNKYNINYYNYENNKAVGQKRGRIETVLGEPDGNGGVIENVDRIAMSQNIEVFPRDVEKATDIPEELKKYSIVYECDLDNDEKIEYLCIEQNKDIVPVGAKEVQNETYKNKYVTKIDLLDSGYKLISNLVTFNDYLTEADEDRDAIYLEDVDIMDIDNDSTMEILIDLLGYEQGGSVAVYKYEKGKIYGKTNYITDILP